MAHQDWKPSLFFSKNESLHLQIVTSNINIKYFQCIWLECYVYSPCLNKWVKYVQTTIFDLSFWGLTLQIWPYSYICNPRAFLFAVGRCDLYQMFSDTSHDAQYFFPLLFSGCEQSSVTLRCKFMWQSTWNSEDIQWHIRNAAEDSNW